MPIAKRLRRYFFRGLAVLLPTILTIMVFVWGYQFIRDKVSVHINRGLVTLSVWVQSNQFSSEAARAAARKEWTDFWVNGWGQVAGFFLAVVCVFIVGAILASVVGRSIWRAVENVMTRAPVLKKIYPYVKQVTDFIFSDEEQREKMFVRAVAVEYPRKGVWALGLVTGAGLRRISDTKQKEFVTVLVPTSPTPFTGFVVTVPKDETIDLDMTIEEAFRFTISGGVITPEGQKAVKVALPSATGQ
jgi:uncharacterized membrane protein